MVVVVSLWLSVAVLLITWNGGVGLVVVRALLARVVSGCSGLWLLVVMLTNRTMLSVMNMNFIVP